MKNLLFLLALVGCADNHSPGEITSSSEVIHTGTPVYLMMGQSTAVGGASCLTLSPEYQYLSKPYTMPFAEELNCSKTSVLEPCVLSTGWLSEVRPHGQITTYPGVAYGNRMGAELSLARGLPPGSALLKHATNGTSAYKNWDASDSQALSSLFFKSMTYIQARMDELPADSYVAGIFWIQGNGDDSDEITAGDYAENLGWLITRWRQELGEMPVVVAAHHASTHGAYVEMVRSEQLQVAQYLDNVFVVETSDLGLMPDYQHYTADGYAQMGQRMAAALP